MVGFIRLKFGFASRNSTSAPKMAETARSDINVIFFILFLFKKLLWIILCRNKYKFNTYINEYEYTHSGILKALIYFFEIKGNSIDKANGGIGIVPYVYKDAYNYYYSLWLAQQKNEHFKPEEYIPVVREIHIPSPQRNVRKRQLFTFLDEEVAEDE